MNSHLASYVALGLGALLLTGADTSSPVAVAATAPQISNALIRADDLAYLGSFRVPGSTGTGNFEYGGGGLAFNPARNSLFLIGWSERYATAELSIPEIGGVAGVLQPLRDPFEGRLPQIGATDNRVGGQLVYRNRLYLTGYIYYDADAGQRNSHFSRPLDLSVAGQVSGPTRVGTMQAGYYSGYMAPVPTEMQAALGGPAVTGNCCIPIISRTSYGPALFGFDPERPTTAKPLVYYTGDNPLEPYGAPGSHPLFNGSTSINGVVIPDRTGSVLFFGTTGIGNYCYGTGAECNDPVGSEKGEHAYPYKAYVWAYRASDLAQVAAGRKRAWEVKPYAAWPLQPFANLNSFGSGGAAFDPATRRLYFVQRNGDSGILPLIHVYQVGLGSTTEAPPPASGDGQAPEVTLRSPSPGSTVTGDVTVLAEASDNTGVAGVQFLVNAVDLGPEDTEPPYETRWATSSSPDGWTLVAAIARDAAGNVGSSNTVTVRVANDAESVAQECAARPFKLNVVQWPTSFRNVWRLGYSTTGPAPVKNISATFGPQTTVTATDERGCIATAVRN